MDLIFGPEGLKAMHSQPLKVDVRLQGGVAAMTIVKAKVKAIGPRRSVEGLALVDTGSSLTLIDREVADSIGVKHLGRKVKIIVADGHELHAELTIVDRLIIEGEELPYTHVATPSFTEELKERLRELELSDWCIIGPTTLELLQLTPNPTTGTLRKSTALLL